MGPGDVCAKSQTGHDELHERADPLLHDGRVRDLPPRASFLAPAVRHLHCGGPRRVTIPRSPARELVAVHCVFEGVEGDAGGDEGGRGVGEVSRRVYREGVVQRQEAAVREVLASEAWWARTWREVGEAR